MNTNYQSALVTGASRGIGEAIVREFRARDMLVHAVALDEPALHEMARDSGAIAHGVDLRDAAALAAVVADLDVDVVVNNAGILTELQSFAVSTAATIDALIDVNLRAALHVTNLVLPGMIERDRGHIFFMGSIAGKHPTPNTATYGATKAALHAFAEGLRCDLLGSSIRVTVLMPGRVQTRLYDGIFGGHDKATEALYDDFDAIQPRDIATVITNALDLPPHVDLTTIEVLPTKQIFGGSTISRNR
jgi:NADP-dependent 3-hydroxy acid dehydrogenase YdfG